MTSEDLRIILLTDDPDRGHLLEVSSGSVVSSINVPLLLRNNYPLSTSYRYQGQLW